MFFCALFVSRGDALQGVLSGAEAPTHMFVSANLAGLKWESVRGADYAAKHLDMILKIGAVFRHGRVDQIGIEVH
jgi:hypothetical protein